ncbi:MAG: ATP synthase F1 subunit epsilon [Lachnospiraceae bacterium]|nr:ATP synthase F1 subunit epsilon [Lachnospiraceae bacterium]
MRNFAIQIISSDGVFFYGRIRHLIVPATDGELGLLPGHEEIILALKEGVLRYQSNDEEWHEAAVGRGTLQFANNRCTVVVDTAERPDQIDIKRAEEARKRAEERLRLKLSEREYLSMQASLARALTRLKITKQDGKWKNI